MALKIPPPVFSKEKSYQRYKDEVEAWRSVANVGKQQQALVIALSLPEGSEVREYVFNDIDIDKLKADDGINVLFQKLDLKYKKDDLTEAYESWRKFDILRKEKEMTMDEFISEFDKRWNQVKKCNNQISSPILAFKMLDRAQLDIRTKQIVLTDVDFNEKDKMYDSMKTALKKYCGSQQLLHSETSYVEIKNEDAIIKSEPISSVAEVNLVGRGRGGYRPRYGRGARRGGQSRGGARNSDDWNGNTLKCYCCGSTQHLARSCPKNVYLASSNENDVKDVKVAEVKEKSPPTLKNIEVKHIKKPGLLRGEQLFLKEIE